MYLLSSSCSTLLCCARGIYFAITLLRLSSRQHFNSLYNRRIFLSSSAKKTWLNILAQIDFTTNLIDNNIYDLFYQHITTEKKIKLPWFQRFISLSRSSDDIQMSTAHECFTDNKINFKNWNKRLNLWAMVWAMLYTIKFHFECKTSDLRASFFVAMILENDSGYVHNSYNTYQ